MGKDSLAALLLLQVAQACLEQVTQGDVAHELAWTVALHDG